jgi:hypothetical protein
MGAGPFDPPEPPDPEPGRCGPLCEHWEPCPCGLCALCSLYGEWTEEGVECDAVIGDASGDF